MNRRRDTTRTGSTGTSNEPRRFGDIGPRRDPSIVDVDAAHHIAQGVSAALDRRPKALKEASESLRGVSPAFYSEIPRKTNPTLAQVEKFVADFSRGSNRPVASSINNIQMPLTTDPTSRPALRLEELFTSAPNLSIMTGPVTMAGSMSNRVGVLSNKGSDRPTLTIVCESPMQGIDQLTGSAPMTVRSFPYKRDLDIRIARPILFEPEGNAARFLKKDVQALSRKETPVSLVSGITLACLSSAPDREDELSVLSELWQSQNRHGPVTFADLSLHLPDPTIDDYKRLSDVYTEADKFGHRISNCSFGPSRDYMPAPSLKQVLTHPTLIRSLRASRTLFRITSLGYPTHEKGFQTIGTAPRKTDREVCFEIGDLNLPDITATAKDTLGLPKDIFITFASNDDSSRFDRFSQAVREERANLWGSRR